MINLRPFQQEAVKQLLNLAKKEIKQTTPRSILLNAPTGSGKTVVMGQFLKQWIENQKSSDPNLSFIWVSLRELHKQSYESIKPVSEGSIFTCTLSDDRGKEIKHNEIIFENWESISHKNKKTALKKIRKGEKKLDYDSIGSCKNSNAHTYQNEKLWAKLQQH